MTPWGRQRVVRTEDRPPVEVYDLVSDVGAMAARSDEVVAAWWVDRADVTTVGVGDRFTARNERRGTTWETTSTVTAAERGHRFAYTVGDDADPTARWSFVLSGPARGPTQVEHTAELGPGPTMLDHVASEHRAHARQRRVTQLGEAMARTLAALDAPAGRVPG